MYAAKVLADSISPDGIRLTTIEATFPRFILAEINTHRVFSRNSASSRAIPPEKHIARIVETPFVPDVFGSRVKGMGQGVPIEDQEMARLTWLEARDIAVTAAQALLELEVAKSLVNRLLEPFMWHTAIISSTAWENFYALRCPPGDEVDLDFPAQPEFQRVAILMREAMRSSNPRVIPIGAWHLPLVSDEERRQILREHANPMDAWLHAAKVSAGRCARVSFDRQGETEPVDASIERADRLLGSGHLSPFEHPATPCIDHEGGNFHGWRQYRWTIPHEENRVGHLEQRPSWEVAPT